MFFGFAFFKHEVPLRKLVYPIYPQSGQCAGLPRQVASTVHFFAPCTQVVCRADPHCQGVAGGRVRLDGHAMGSEGDKNRFY